jgi:hypothetical protein
MGKDGIFAQAGSKGEPVTGAKCRLAQGHGRQTPPKQARAPQAVPHDNNKQALDFHLRTFNVSNARPNVIFFALL